MNMKTIVKGDRTIRKFQQKKINNEDLQDIMENVRFAHCSNNRQLLRYMVVTDDHLCKCIGKEVHYAASLPRDLGQPKENEEAVAYVIILVPVNAGAIQDIDVGIVAEVITASAYEKNIGCCMMLNFNVSNINAILDIPFEYKARMVISMGYPALTSIVEDVKEDNLNYYIDEEKNYHVPKRSLEELVQFK